MLMRLDNVLLALVLTVWGLCLVYDLICGNHNNNEKDDESETEC